MHLYIEQFCSIRIWVIIYLCFLFVSCSDDVTEINENGDPIQNTEAISQMAGRLEIRVDPRIEFISVVMKAESFEEKHLQEPTLKQEIANYFLPYKDHPAVEMVRKLRAGFGINT